MRFQNALDNAKLSIRFLLMALILSFMTNLLLGYGLISAPDKVNVYIPPRIPDDGITLKPNEVPAASIFAFTNFIWQSLHYWPRNGSEDYKTNILNLSPYFTPRFASFLKQDYNNRLNQGELQSRISTMQPLYGTSFEPADVEYVGNGTWHVRLVMRLTERMNINDQTVKDAEIQYTLKIVMYSINPEKNKWGLAIDGLVKSPERIRTVI